MGIVTIERGGVFVGVNGVVTSVGGSVSDNPGSIQVGWHLYLVYKETEDAPEEEWEVIRAGRATDNSSPTGTVLDTFVGLLNESNDFYREGDTSESRGAHILASGSSADTLWNDLKSTANEISDSYHAYSPGTSLSFGLEYTLNSNSFIANVLDGAGIDIFNNNLPLDLGLYPIPGLHTVIGTNGNDQLNGAPYDPISDALGLFDVIAGGEGDDVIDGGQGRNILDGEGGNDILIGGEHKDILIGSDSRIREGSDNDILIGGDGDDELYGGIGSDILIGGADDDKLFDGGNSEVLGNYSDLLDGGEGNDAITLSCPSSGIYGQMLA